VELPHSGFGLAGMRERVEIAGGTLSLESGHAGTSVRARLPTAGADVLPLRREQMMP
jgi:signal transduction histidine kinase